MLYGLANYRRQLKPVPCLKAVRSLRYDGEDLIIDIQGEGFAFARVVFRQPDGFRMLDERDLCEFWNTYSEPNGWLYEVEEGGWLELERHRPKFNSPEFSPELREYWLVDDKCINVLTEHPPERQRRSTHWDQLSNPEPKRSILRSTECALKRRYTHMPKNIHIDASRISDWDSFHDLFAETLGFPNFYGRNMDAWIDCMTCLDDPDAGMTSVHVAPGDIVVLCMSAGADFKKRCSEIYDALIECSSFVNYRRIQTGAPAILALSF